ncbi:unnamed protein product [Camellia sinensis]
MGWNSLGGFMAFLVADVPSQAHWILELTKYDFKGAVGRLVASVPGIHSRRAPCILEPMYFLPDCIQLGFLPRNVAKWGPIFSDISKVVQFEHVSAICLLVASIQRSTGLWRLQEVLSSSSTGLVTAQFLAVFLAAYGKTSVQFSESDESDPDVS